MRPPHSLGTGMLLGNACPPTLEVLRRCDILYAQGESTMKSLLQTYLMTTASLLLLTASTLYAEPLKAVVIGTVNQANGQAWLKQELLHSVRDGGLHRLADDLGNAHARVQAAL
jgi:hypothetical protein